MKSIFKTIIPLSLVFAVLVSTNFLYAQWTAPSGTPSAANNAPAPINISAVNQVKTGGLSVGALSVADNVYIQGGNTTATPSGAVNLEVEGKVGSGQFCDTNGNNCFSATQVRDAINSTQIFSMYTRFAKDYYWGGTNFFGSDINKRVSYARANCDTGDYAINFRKIELSGSSACSLVQSQILDAFNSYSPTYFDANNISWGTAEYATYGDARAYNGCDRLGARGSVAAVEVRCLKIDLTQI